MGNNFDVIKLTLPFKAEYVGIARLTASGVANRIGFDIETIEDIKVAVAEVCNRMVEIGSKVQKDYNIIFKVHSDCITIIFNCDDKDLKLCFNDASAEFGISIITALMDDVEFSRCDQFDEENIVSMTKALEGNK